MALLITNREIKNCLSPAKLNLFLYVTGQREDGYHTLYTQFQLINWCDTLHFKKRDDNVISCQSNVKINDYDNLIIRAAKQLQKFYGQNTNQPLGVDIILEKKIPMGGGLGGGSSNAATTLLALNRLWQCHLSQKQLHSLGVTLGADIPFFLFGHNAIGEGIGDVLTKKETRQQYFVIIVPPVYVSTKQLFASFQLTSPQKNHIITNLPMHDLSSLLGYNDLQATAVQLFPEIGHAIDDLKVFGPTVMTGSGSCVFASFSKKEDAQKAYQALQSRWTVKLIESLSFHPLLSLWEND